MVSRYYCNRSSSAHLYLLLSEDSSAQETRQRNLRKTHLSSSRLALNLLVADNDTTEAARSSPAAAASTAAFVSGEGVAEAAAS